MTDLDAILPPWLLDYLPQEYPLLVVGLTVLAIFLWLRIGALLIGMARDRRRRAAVGPPPVSDGAARDCIWEPDARPAPWGRSRWRCAYCGGVEFTDETHPPQYCMRNPKPL
ncbi:hypothetical protein [Nioella aestuarii]|uniref:hypothetical protein n=1 Tax=Nioella aestuarii TaxID=1662864 RepID=UPI003D7F3DA1